MTSFSYFPWSKTFWPEVCQLQGWSFELEFENLSLRLLRKRDTKALLHALTCGPKPYGSDGCSILIGGTPAGVADFTLAWQAWQWRTICSQSLSRPSHQNALQKCCFICMIPGWPMCCSWRSHFCRETGVAVTTTEGCYILDEVLKVWKSGLYATSTGSLGSWP